MSSTESTRFEEELYSHLSNKRAPILFIGSGFVRRYTGSDDWEGLLRRFAQKTNKQYGQYLGEAEGDKPRIASLIANDFWDIWWNTENQEYQSSRLEHPEPANKTSPLKVEVANHFKKLSKRETIEPYLQKELDDLRIASKRAIATVVTTNFDSFTDSLFEDFTVSRSQDELLLSTPFGGKELYKIHGCCSDPESIVLTEEDYTNFNEKSPYLAAKLLTLFAEHPVIFLGYSIDDPHIQQLILNVARALSKQDIKRLAGNLIFVTRIKNGNSSLAQSPFSFSESPDSPPTVVPMLYANVTEQDYGSIFGALKELKPKIPTHIVAQLKSEVYEIISSEKPSDRIFARDIESLDSMENHEQIEVVVGVGIRDALGLVGYSGITRTHLLSDLLEENVKLSGQSAGIKIVEHVLPTIRSNVYVPIYKYLHDAGLLDGAGNLLTNSNVDSKLRARAEKYESRFTPSSPVKKKAEQHANTYPSVELLIENVSAHEAIEAVMCLPKENVKTEDLRQLIVKFLDDTEEMFPTAAAKAVCQYDYFVYGPGKIYISTPNKFSEIA